MINILDLTFEDAEISKIPPAKEKTPENSRSVKCLIVQALTQ